MNHHRLIVLLAVCVLLLGFLLLQFNNGALAGNLPPPMPGNRLQAVASTKAYLPMVLNNYTVPVPPPFTTSRYVATTNLIQMNTAGCNQGQAGEGGVVILDFGYPYYDATAGYGTKLLSYGTPFVDNLTIENLTWEFMKGWVRCRPAGKTLEIAMGLNNSPKFWQMNASQARVHGTQWAAAVLDQAQMISINSDMVGKVSVAGAMDIEFPWNTPTVTRAWVDGFDPGWTVPFYNFGSCDSCPWFEDPGWTPGNGWQIEDVYYVSSRQTANGTVNLPFPISYKRDHEHADQWYRMSLYGVNQHSTPLFFRGTLTQWYACHEYDNWTECVTTNTYNRPEEGWSMLWQALNSNPQTAVGAPVVSTDIRWYVTAVR